MKLKTLFKLMFCGQLKYLNYAWSTTANNSSPIRNAWVVKLWSLLYFAVALTCVSSPLLLCATIFPVPQGRSRPPEEALWFFWPLLSMFISLLVFIDHYYTQRVGWNIFNRMREFNDALRTIIKAVLQNSNATEADIHHLGWTTRSIKRSEYLREKRVFPERIVNRLNLQLFNIAEAVKEYDLLPPNTAKSTIEDLNYQQDKAALKKLFEACQGFGLFSDITLMEIYAKAKQNVLTKKKCEAETVQESKTSQEPEELQETEAPQEAQKPEETEDPQEAEVS